MNSDEDFMLYRRFGIVSSRLLLHKQDQLAAMESRLFRLDNEDTADGHTIRSRKMSEMRDQASGEMETRTQLLAQMERKLLEYSKISEK